MEASTVVRHTMHPNLVSNCSGLMSCFSMIANIFARKITVIFLATKRLPATNKLKVCVHWLKIHKKIR